MSIALQTQKITQTWDIKKMQAAATKMVSHKIATRIHFLKKHHAKEIDEMEKSAAHLEAEELMRSGVKTPLDLVKYLAEYEVNMFGSEASISGDDQCAVLINEKPTVWLQAKHDGSLDGHQSEAMQEHYTAWMKHLGHKLGFKAHVEIAKDGKSSKVTFMTN